MFKIGKCPNLGGINVQIHGMEIKWNPLTLRWNEYEIGVVRVELKWNDLDWSVVKVKWACTLFSETSWVLYLNVIVVKWGPSEWTWMDWARYECKSNGVRVEGFEWNAMD